MYVTRVVTGAERYVFCTHEQPIVDRQKWSTGSHIVFETDDGALNFAVSESSVYSYSITREETCPPK